MEKFNIHFKNKFFKILKNILRVPKRNPLRFFPILFIIFFFLADQEREREIERAQFAELALIVHLAFVGVGRFGR